MIRLRKGDYVTTTGKHEGCIGCCGRIASDRPFYPDSNSFKVDINDALGGYYHVHNKKYLKLLWRGNDKIEIRLKDTNA